MNISSSFRRLLLGAGLALAALAGLAPAAPSTPAQAAAPPTLGPIQIKAAGTSAVVTVTSAEPVSVRVDAKATAPVTAFPRYQTSEIYTTAHALTLTGLASNTTYSVTVAARALDGRTATARESFATLKKRVRITLESIDITGDGEPVWFVKPIWDGASYSDRFNDGALCYPNTGGPGACEPSKRGEGHFTPLNESGKALQLIFAEENFDRFPSTVAVQVWAEEDDAIGGAWTIECVTNPGCPAGDDAESREWRVSEGVEFAEQTITVRGDDSDTGFASVLTFRFELVQVHAPYPWPFRNVPAITWFVGK